MLHSFLAANRSQLIERCRVAAFARKHPVNHDHEVIHGIPLFLDQLIETLSIEQTGESIRSRSISGPPTGESAASEIGDSAALHGRELLEQGFTLEQVVRAYGDICPAVTNLAHETHAPIEVDEFRTFNRCLDNAIAGAVTEYSFQQATGAAEEGKIAANSGLGSLAHELRNYLHIAMHAMKAIKAGNVGVSGATGAVLDRSLIGMRNLIDTSLAEVRVTAGLRPRTQPLRLADFLHDVEAAASLDPRSRTIQLTITPVDRDLEVYADAEMLTSALGNLLQNAFKFTQPNTTVTVHSYCEANRVLIEVKDHCGGLPPGSAEQLLQPFVQSSEDRSGLGLGLDICRRSIEANHGTLRVRDNPGVGCVFTIDLPRYAEPASLNSKRPDASGITKG